ncbi:MAG: glycosyltransferase family 2 protein [Candidatus Eisenbacteria bacterium]|uniref:Glycosyltransferase family 2 protein n=1 Tax=Eiseniibacteriota bacterium TaxID=2212470 RepID=A0A849SHW2_UNCEI|nr:glycosyltransferase family 2 protein [Candidatus Eisenbacteria bacterium]
MNALWPSELWRFATGVGAWTPPGPQHVLVFAVVFCAIVDFVKLVIELLGRNAPRAFSADPTQVSAVIPSRDGAAVIAGTIEDLKRFLPAAQILVVDDGSRDDTAAVARSLGAQVFRFEHSKGKAGAINFAVHRVATPLTLLLDDDTRLGGARLPTSLITDDDFDAVAFHVLPDRRERNGARGNRFLGHLQRYEYGKSMEIGKRFHDTSQSVSCISGAIGLFRTRDLDRLHHAHSGVFQGEDLQRTLIHLLNGKRIVFANEPVWTVAPSRLGDWLRQRLWGWYPGLYHQFGNIVRLLFHRDVAWRLRYEMLYNVYTLVSDPLKTWSIVTFLLVPALRSWALVIYLVYLAFELYPWWVVRLPGTGRRAPLLTLFVFPIYGALNVALRTFAILTWLWMRFVSGVMKPRRGPKDRIA